MSAPESFRWSEDRVKSEGHPDRDGAIHSLVLTSHHLYPPHGGAPLRNWQNVCALAELGPVDVVSIGPGEGGPPPMPVRRWTHFDLSRLPHRGGLLEPLRKRSWWFRPRTHPWSLAMWRKEIIEAVDEMLRAGKPELVLLEEVWLHPFASLTRRLGCLTVFDAHNVERQLRPQLAPPQSGLVQRLRRKRLSLQVAAIERDLTMTADQTWCCSEADARNLANEADARRSLHVIPNTMDLDHYAPVREGAFTAHEARGEPVIVFVGSYSYAPNEVAARILVEEILPTLESQLGEVSLLLVGRDPKPWMLESARSRRGLRVTGAVADVRPYLAEASVVAVPLTQGGGTRLKILEAFAALRPVVSTPKGAEGLDVVDGKHLCLREPADFAAAIVELLSSPAATTDMTSRAFALVKERYSWPVAAQRIHTAVAELTRGRDGVR